MSALRFDHLSAVVGDIDAATTAIARLLGVAPGASLALPGMAIRSFPLGDGEIHLLAPTGPGPVDEHHRAYGAGFHHLALRVAHLDAALEELASQGFRALGAPVETAPGLREVFLDPKATGGLLIQLVERRSPTDPDELNPASIERLAAQSWRPR